MLALWGAGEVSRVEPASHHWNKLPVKVGWGEDLFQY